MYEIRGKKLCIRYEPENFGLVAATRNSEWKFDRNPSLALETGGPLLFTEAECRHRAFCDSITDGVRAEYAFDGGIVAITFIGIEIETDRLRIEIYFENERDFQIRKLKYPTALKFEAEKGRGYTILPLNQGALIPARYCDVIQLQEKEVLKRELIMPFFGQVRGDSGYLAIIDTPFDSLYTLNHAAGGDTEIFPLFIPRLEKMDYKRVMLYSFKDDYDYVKMAKDYRFYKEEKSGVVTLREKIARNSRIEYLVGAPIVHEGVARHIDEKSAYYTPGQPGKNNRYVTFDSLGEQLRLLKSKGVEKAYLHLDGWGVAGYDNQHPDPFPPHEAAGGAAGMKKLSQTCRELSYMLGIHDQYWDYYYNARTFSFDNAIQNRDGTHIYKAQWLGGSQSYLCATLAPGYVRRNYNYFMELGIELDGSYIDCFSISRINECFNPMHRMTREDCVNMRLECFAVLTSRGIIPSSEGTVDCYISAFPLCHHSPYYTKPFVGEHIESTGVGVPLFSLVYHDCMIVPWYGAMGKNHDMFIPTDEWAYLHALLNAGTVYVSPAADEASLARVKTALGLFKHAAHLQMVSHEFTDGSYRKQKTTFSDGTEVSVDFDADSFEIRYPSKKENGSL